MPDSKISALPSATVPLAGTEVLPVVQGGTTDKVTAADLLRQNGQTVTTSNPVLSLAQTWNAGGVTFTGMQLAITDTASSGSSLLALMTVGGNTKFKIDKEGTVDSHSAFRVLNNSGFLSVGSGVDLYLYRDAANTWGQRNGTNAQTFNIYNTYTDASNYERLFVSGSLAGEFTIVAQRAGTGTHRALNIGTYSTAALKFMTSGTGRWSVGSSGHITAETDNTYDIGASGATRPRTGYFGTSAVVGAFPAGQPVAALNGYGSSWSFIGSASATDAVDKAMRLGGAHYTNAEEPLLALYTYSSVSANAVAIGGGTSSGNAATQVDIYTAANTTTVTGTQRWTWSSSGHYLAAADNTYDIGASGATRPRNLFVAGTGTFGGDLTSAGSVVCGSGSGFNFGVARGSIQAASDGVFRLLNNAGTDFSRLQFGGTTSSFPALKRSANSLDVRYADDSGDATLNAGSLRSTGSVFAGYGTAIPAGGNNGIGLKGTSTANFGVFFGSGAPTLSAAKGSLYLRSDGSGTGDRMYVNTDGSTTWTAVTTAA